MTQVVTTKATQNRKAADPSEATKKPKRKKAQPRITLKAFIPNHREFQKEAARLEAMLGPEADPDAVLDLPEGMSREWARDAWQVVKANAEIQFRPLKSGTEFPSGIYADRAWLATLQMTESPFNDKIQRRAISQMLSAGDMKERAAKRRARAARKAEASQA